MGDETSERGCSKLRYTLFRTKVSPFGNLVTKIAASQKGLRNLFPFEYLLSNHLINNEHRGGATL